MDLCDPYVFLSSPSEISLVRNGVISEVSITSTVTQHAHIQWAGMEVTEIYGLGLSMDISQTQKGVEECFICSALQRIDTPNHTAGPKYSNMNLHSADGFSLK